MSGYVEKISGVLALATALIGVARIVSALIRQHIEETLTRERTWLRDAIYREVERNKAPLVTGVMRSSVPSQPSFHRHFFCRCGNTRGQLLKLKDDRERFVWPICEVCDHAMQQTETYISGSPQRAEGRA